MKTMLAVGVGVLTIMTLASDERKFARAVQQWQRDRSLGSLLHLATCGFFLAEDLAP